MTYHWNFVKVEKPAWDWLCEHNEYAKKVRQKTIDDFWYILELNYIWKEMERWQDLKHKDFILGNTPRRRF